MQKPITIVRNIRKRYYRNTQPPPTYTYTKLTGKALKL